MSITLERFVASQLAPELAGHKKPKVLLLTCMDYRYAHRIVNVMDHWGLRQGYDMFVLAGASLGANKNKVWRETLVSHIRTARTIDHPIDHIIILEHRQCGAYTHFLGLEWDKVTPPVEEAAHKQQVEQLISDLRAEFAKEIPGLKFDSFLLTRDEDDELHIETAGP